MVKQAQARARRTRAAPEPAEQRKVVVRYTNGRVLRGFFPALDDAALEDSLAESIVVKNCDGKRVKVAAAELKAVFFVKSFEGNPDYSEFKVFSARPSGRGVWVRIRFKDGEMLEGVAPNRLQTYVSPIFHMTPPDPGSNNQAILVSKRHITEMAVLGLASDKSSSAPAGPR